MPNGLRWPISCPSTTGTDGSTRPSSTHTERLAGFLHLPVLPATLIPSPERLGIPDIRIPPLQAVGLLVARPAAAFATQGRTKAVAIHVLVQLEVVPQGPVVFLFGVAQPKPPILPRRIEALRPGVRQQLMCALFF